MTSPPEDHVAPKDRVKDQDWTGVVAKSAAAISTADKGWILAFVILFGMLAVSNHLSSVSREEVTSEQNQQVAEFLNQVSENDAALTTAMLSLIREMTNALARCGEARVLKSDTP